MMEACCSQVLSAQLLSNLENACACRKQVLPSCFSLTRIPPPNSQWLCLMLKFRWDVFILTNRILPSACHDVTETDKGKIRPSPKQNRLLAAALQSDKLPQSAVEDALKQYACH